MYPGIAIGEDVGGVGADHGHAAVSIDGGDEVPVSLYIDLASGEAIEMLIQDGMLYELPAGLEEVYLGRGLSGDINGYKGRISSFRLGPYMRLRAMG